MPTTIKTRKSKPPIKGQASRGFPRPRRTTQTARPRDRFPRTSTKPAAKGPSGLIGRAQATLPGRKPPAKNSAVKGVVSSLGSAKNSALARKPSKKGIVGILDAKPGGVPMTEVASQVEASRENRDLAADHAPNSTPIGQGGIVEIPKEQIRQMLRGRGDHDQAQQADQQLADQVDPERHAGLLGQIGIDPGVILGGAGGRLGR